MSSRRSSRRSARSSSRTSRQGAGGPPWADIAKIALGIVILGGLGTALFVTRARTEAIDPITFCNRAGPSAVTLVVLDASDPIDGVQIERVKAQILNAAEQSATGTRIDIFVADTPDGRLASPVFSKCNPGAPGAYDSLVSDAARNRAAFDESYLAAIEDTLGSLLVVEPAKSSPIIESVRSAATASLARLEDGVPVDLYIVSDMVQNTRLLRQKTGEEAFEDFKSGAGWPNALVDLRGARIHLIYVARSQYNDLQGREHQIWWEDYFDAVNGRVTSIDAI